MELSKRLDAACTIIGLENGLRISNVMCLEKSDIENMLAQNVDHPSMEISTQKSGVLAEIHLSPESQQVIKAYLKTIPKNQEKLFRKDMDTVAKSLQKSFRLACSDIDFKPTFKCFRQMFLSTGSNLRINEWHLRYMCGKKVPDDILPYLRNLDLRSDFIRIKSRLTIRPQTAQIPEIKHQLDTIFKILRSLVEEKLSEKGLLKVKPTDWFEIYEKLLPEKQRKEKVIRY